MKDLFKAIYTRFTATPTTALYTALGGRLYNTGAPVGSLLPLAVMSLITNISDQLMEKCTVQISLFSDKASDTEIFALYDALIALYDNCDLPLLGHPSNLGMERGHSVLFKEEGVWQYVVEYEVWVERK